MAPFLRALVLAACMPSFGVQGVSRRLSFREQDKVTLSQTSVQRTDSSLTARREPLGASWFDSFHEAESNYDMEADRFAQHAHGWEYKKDDPETEETVMKAVFYHESPSGGGGEAWQTHYPAVGKGPAGRPKSIGLWHVNQGGHWTQDYQLSEPPEPGPVKPQWFQSGILQYDGWGRSKSPVEGSPKLYSTTHQERSVNTTLSCKEAGCEAFSFLQAFDGIREIGRDCKLSLYLHPTDFDDQYSGERLAFIKVNGVTVNTDCYPMVSGCNASAQMAMFSCVQDLPVDHVIDKTGFLNVSAKISDVVDECPYQGNLLSGVPIVTCLVTPRPTPQPPAAEAATPSYPVVHTPVADSNYFHIRVPLHCPYRGCVAEASMAISPETAKRVTSCNLNLRVQQTDFDNEEGTKEAIEYIEVGGVRVASDMVPGYNPCRSLWAGKPLSLEQKEHVALQDFDVTQNASDGLVSVVAKITDHVDECARDGYLLNGLAEINCTLTTREIKTPAPRATALANASNATEVTELVQVLGQAFPRILHRKRRPDAVSDLQSVLLQNLRR